MSQNSNIARPDEEAFTVLLIVAAFGFAGLFIVVKLIGNALSRLTAEKEQLEGEVGWDNELTKKTLRLITNFLEIETDTEAAGTQFIQATAPELQVLPTQHDPDYNYEEGLEEILAWEEATIDSLQRAKARALEELSAIDEISELRGSFLVSACEKNLKRGLQREKERRLDSLSSQRETGRDREHGLDSIRAWQEFTINGIQHEKTRILTHLSSLAQQDEGQANAFIDVQNWESSAIRAFQKEKARRLELLPPLPNSKEREFKIFFQDIQWGEQSMLDRFQRETERVFLNAVCFKEHLVPSLVAAWPADEEESRKFVWENGRWKLACWRVRHD